MQHPELHDLITEFYQRAKHKHDKDYIARIEIGIDNSCEEAMNSINKIFEAKQLETQFLVHKATKKPIKERININKQAMGKDILKINPRLTPIIGALEALK